MDFRVVAHTGSRRRELAVIVEDQVLDATVHDPEPQYRISNYFVLKHGETRNIPIHDRRRILVSEVDPTDV